MKMCFSEMSFLPLYPFFAAAVIEGKIGKADLEIEERKGGEKAKQQQNREGGFVRWFVRQSKDFPLFPPRCKKWGLS